MRNKKEINNLIEFRIKNQVEVFKGLLIDYSEEWTLLHNNPVDYVMDGYLIIKNSFVKSYTVSPAGSLRTKILRKKELKIKKQTINIESSKLLLQTFLKKNIVFSINTANNSYLIGRITNISDSHIRFEKISPKAKWSEIKEIKLDEILVMEYETDYINSLLLVAE